MSLIINGQNRNEEFHNITPVINLKNIVTFLKHTYSTYFNHNHYGKPIIVYYNKKDWIVKSVENDFITKQDRKGLSISPSNIDLKEDECYVMTVSSYGEPYGCCIKYLPDEMTRPLTRFDIMDLE